MFIKHPADSWDSDEFVFKFERKFKCTVCCFNRPSIDVVLGPKGKEIYQGTVVNPCLCFELGMDVYDENKNLVYNIRGSVCQQGVLC